MYQLSNIINQRASVRHVSKILLLRLVLAEYCIDKRQHSKLQYCLRFNVENTHTHCTNKWECIPNDFQVLSSKDMMATDK